MLTPRRIFVLFVLVIVSLLAGGNLAKLRLHLPRFPSQLLNSTNFSARPTSQLDQPSPSHVADLEQPSTRPDLVPKISGPAVELYTPPGPQTYPRVIKLRSGNLLAVLATYEPENTIALSISQDQGISWHPYGFVATAQASNIQVGNAFLLELPSTRLLAAYRRHTLKQEAVGVEEKPGGQNEGYLYYKLMIYFSDDVGKTWHYLSTPVQGPGPRHGLWEPFLRLANNGSLQLFYSQEEGGRDQDNLMRVSSDGGKTWSGQIFVSGQDMATRDGMMGIQELEVGSGVLMAVFESVEEKAEEGHFEARFEVWCSISRDDGNTWGERRMIYDGWWNEPVEHSLKRNAGAPQIALVGTTLVVSFMTDEVKLEGMWHRNAFVKIITSDDGGVTWGNNMIIADMPAAWAGLVILNDTDFLVLCEHHSRVEARPVSLVPKERVESLSG